MGLQATVDLGENVHCSMRWAGIWSPGNAVMGTCAGPGWADPAFPSRAFSFPIPIHSGAQLRFQSSPQAPVQPGPSPRSPDQHQV